MTTGDIQAHLAEIYDTEVSRDTISRITDMIVEDLQAWQSRPLDSQVPISRQAAVAVAVAIAHELRPITEDDRTATEYLCDATERHSPSGRPLRRLPSTPTTTQPKMPAPTASPVRSTTGNSRCQRRANGSVLSRRGDRGQWASTSPADGLELAAATLDDMGGHSGNRRVGRCQASLGSPPIDPAPSISAAPIDLDMDF